MADEMQSVLQHHRAQQLMNTYTKNVDTKNVAAMESIAHPDIELIRREGNQRGVEAFMNLYRDFSASDVMESQHMTTNLEVTEQADGSLAVKARFIAITTHPDAGARWTWGRYDDEMAEHNGSLVFTAKRITVIRTALVPEDMLAPLGTTSFAKIPQS